MVASWSSSPELAAFAEHLDDQVTDIVLNPDGRLWLDRGDGLREVHGWSPPTREQQRALAVRLVARGGRHLDDASPIADARLPDGVRVHAVLQPISVHGAVISLRLPRRDGFTLERLEGLGMFESVPRALVQRAVDEHRTVLVSGATGAGKTALLGAMIAAVDARERVLLVEDVAELVADHPGTVSLQVRQPNVEGAGAIGLDRLVRETLRMRPDRIVVGECRGPELRELLAALNSGHVGSLGTVHANSLEAVPARLESLGAAAGLDAASVRHQVAASIDLVLHVSRTPSGRRLQAAGRPVLDDGGRMRIERLAE